MKVNDVVTWEQEPDEAQAVYEMDRLARERMNETN